MFTPFVRLLILAICSGLSIFAAVYNIRTLLVLSAVASVTMLIGYFRSSTIQLALRAVLSEDFDKAEKLLLQIRYPQRLSRKNRLYYLFCQGIVARGREDYPTATAALEEAVTERLHPDQYQAMALLALTDIHMVEGDREKARYYFSKMKNLKVSPALMESVRKMQSWLG